jgi:hypothetical protein
MTDDATPAAAQAGQGAPRLTADQEARIRQWQATQGGVFSSWTERVLLNELDATRADLQQARAEAARQFRGMVWAHYELAKKLGAADTLWLLDLMSGVLAGKTADEAAASARHATSEPAGAAGEG